jgi:predicted alpha/beta-fold hydrolase
MLYLYKKRNFNIVNVDFRGYSYDLLDHKTVYETGIDDTNFIINHIVSKYPNNNIYLCGYSLSGCVFANILKTYNYNNIKGLILLSSPININKITSQSDNKYFNYPEKILLYYIQKYFNKNNLALHHPLLTKQNKKNILNMKSLNDFFINYIKPIHNNKYININDWSKDHDLIHILKYINIPTLIIHSSDDFICSYDDNTLNIISKNKNISYIITKNGGHNGFLKNNKKLYYSNYVLNFIISTEKNN